MKAIRYRAWVSDVQFMSDVTSISFKGTGVRHVRLLRPAPPRPATYSQAWNQKTPSAYVLADRVELMELTPIPDKSGGEIWEGDLLAIQQYANTSKGMKPNGQRVIVVKRVDFGNFSDAWNITAKQSSSYTVIGNIKQNPELIPNVHKKK